MPAPWPFQTLGSPVSPAVVFLHGFLGRGVDWLPVARRIARHAFCVLPDLPGHGDHTGLDFHIPLNFRRINEGLLQLLDALSLDGVVLVGYSLGGRISLHFACTHPERVRSLVLESTSPGLDDLEERRARAQLDDARAAELMSNGLSAFLDTWYRADLWRSLQARPQMLRRLLLERSAQDEEWMAKVIAELSPGRMPSLWGCLPGLSMPVGLVVGGLDEKYRRISARMAGMIPGAQRIVVPGAGHNVHLEDEGAFHSVLRDFFDERV